MSDSLGFEVLFAGVENGFAVIFDILVMFTRVFLGTVGEWTFNLFFGSGIFSFMFILALFFMFLRPLVVPVIRRVTSAK